MNKGILLRPCPVCDNAFGAERLHTQSFALPDNHLLPNQYDVIACDRCGFVYADTPAKQSDYDKYYAEMSKYDMNYTCADSSLYVDRAAWIHTFIRNKEESIIDIGCGNGQLLLELQRLGLSDLTGLDPSEKCISDLKEKGIQGITGSVFTLSTKKKYDGAILSGVLEHIYDVSTLMEVTKQILRKRGLLFVCVPDASQYRNYDSIPFDYFNTEHINHFDETSLINLGLHHGFNTTGFLKTTITLSRTTQPMIFIAFSNDGIPSDFWPSYSRNCIADYIRSTQRITGIRHLINHLIETQEEIIIWGAGNFTCRLLADSGLDQCNIDFIVDKDVHKQGTRIGSLPVRAPSAIVSMEKSSTILVGAAIFHDDIISDIEAMGIRNKVLVLK